jgi:hypothetical protein
LHPIVIEGVGDMIADADRLAREKWEQAQRLEVAKQRRFLKEQLSLLDDQDALPSLNAINGKS